MTSNLVMGERKWGTSSRRGGKTVLGKVVVPKPINLPSQRLENHGLDPNIEIVPKGTLNWGNRQSSTTNAWGSNSLSPKIESGRPSSSGGNGTRPSTAGSDRSSEPTPNAWGSSSRPSSASGTITSSQSSITTLRPRSADTRPGSSQLSRFAELSHETAAWTGSGTSDKLVVTPENDGFNLSSGDFPTLGAEKENSSRNANSQDHGSSRSRPSSSSGRGLDVKERTETSPNGGDIPSNENVKNGTLGDWRDDRYPYGGPGFRPNVDQGAPYQNANMAPQQFPPWHTSPVNNPPPSVWYRGPPGGPPYGPPPYGPPVGPGGFPMGHPYYRPQMPGPAPQHVSGPGPRGHQVKNGDMFRPQMPDAYIRPGMPVNPGFYAGQVPREGFYAPNMGYCNPGQGDVPFMGAAGPAVYNRYPNQHAFDSGNFRPRTGRHSSGVKSSVPEQSDYGHLPDPHGHKVLLKQGNGWEERDREKKLENASEYGRGRQPATSSWDDDLGPDYCKDENMESERTEVGEVAPHQIFGRGDTSVPVISKLPENVGSKLSDFGKSQKGVAENSVKKVESSVLPFPEVSAVPKDSSLIQKIEGLNAKARASDGADVTSVPRRGEGKTRAHFNVKDFHSTGQDNTGAIYQERPHATVAYDGVQTGDKNSKMAATSKHSFPSRRAGYGMQGRIDHHGKSSPDFKEADGLHKKTFSGNASSAASASDREYTNILLQEGGLQTDSDLKRKDGGEATSMVVPGDSHEQRAKLKETGQQRAKQLQKEEEERIKEQKAKALAKLEELNKRTQAVETNAQKSETASSCIVHNIREEQASLPKQVASTSEMEASDSVSSAVGSVTSMAPQNAIFSDEPPPEFHNKSHQKSHGLKKGPLSQESSVSKPIGFNHQDSIPSEKGVNETETSSATEPSKGRDGYVLDSTGSVEVIVGEIAVSFKSSIPVDTNLIYEGAAFQRKKNNWSGKDKHKAEEGSSLVDASSIVSNHVQASANMGISKVGQVDVQPSSSLPVSSSRETQSLEQGSPPASEEHHSRMNNQWKTQNSRKLPRNHHASRVTDKLSGRDSVVWAPVQSHNRELNEETHMKSVHDEAISPTRKSDTVHNNMKNKRAEMERYVPKPVAKEMAQQASAQHPNLSDCPSVSHESVSRLEGDSQLVVSANMGLSVDSRNGDGKQNKQTKRHASWRQRVSTEPVISQGLQDRSSYSTGLDTIVQEPMRVDQLLNVDTQAVRDQLKSSDDISSPEEQNTLDALNSGAANTVSLVKDHGMATRGKRYHHKGQRGKLSGSNDRQSSIIINSEETDVASIFKGQKGTSHGNNDLDSKNFNSGDGKADTQSSISEPNDTDRSISKENRSAGEHLTSHWLPKYHAGPAYNRRDSRPIGRGQRVGDASRSIKKGPAGGDDNLQYMNEEGNENANQPRRFQPARSNMGESRNTGHPETKREIKESLNARSRSPNFVSFPQVDPPPPGEDPQHEQQRPSSGSRKYGNQNSRYGRGHESGDRSSAFHEGKQHNQPYNRGRQRHNNAQYEYQPISAVDSKFNDVPESDSSHNSGSRFRDRGHGHSRRGGGNSYGRQVQDGY